MRIPVLMTEKEQTIWIEDFDRTNSYGIAFFGLSGRRNGFRVKTNESPESIAKKFRWAADWIEEKNA